MGGMTMTVRLATLEDVEHLHNLHFKLNRHRHELQPKNFQGKSVDEEWIEENLRDSHRDYLVLEVEGEVRGMALVEMLENYSIPGSVKYKYLNILDFMIDPELEIETHGHQLLKAVRQWGKERYLSYIQLNELANDIKKIDFFAKEQLAVTQKTFKCVI